MVYYNANAFLLFALLWKADLPVLQTENPIYNTYIH